MGSAQATLWDALEAEATPGRAAEQPGSKAWFRPGVLLQDPRDGAVYRLLEFHPAAGQWEALLCGGLRNRTVVRWFTHEMDGFRPVARTANDLSWDYHLLPDGMIVVCYDGVPQQDLPPAQLARARYHLGLPPEPAPEVSPAPAPLAGHTRAELEAEAARRLEWVAPGYLALSYPADRVEDLTDRDLRQLIARLEKCRPMNRRRG